eukprot:TRINITY_DN4339_c2_g1_i1.p1 TRINITY_DN4339_c2_g1~~TRINITY_DN4339_c2_g1_i1.p1  ORF type:complete len:722 (+),score=165.77 TRINITY_DN4339_c2_g1_i1:12-2177(+)
MNERSVKTCKVWVKLVDQSDEESEEVNVPLDATVSTLKRIVFENQIFEVTNVSSIKVLMSGKTLSNRLPIFDSNNSVSEPTFTLSITKTIVEETGFPINNAFAFGGIGKQSKPLPPPGILATQSIQTKPTDTTTTTTTTSTPVSKENNLADKYKKYFEIKLVSKGQRSAGTSEEQETNQGSDQHTIIIIKDKKLKETLRSETGGMLGQLYEQEPELEAYQLVVFLNQFKERIESYGSTHPLAYLVEWLTNEYKGFTKRIDEMLSENLITFGTLWYIFSKGTKVYKFDSASECYVGTEVSSFQYKTTMFNEIFIINGTVIQSNGSKFVSTQKSFIIPQFSGTRKLSDLPIRLMDDKVYQELQERGKKFVEYGTGSYFMNYTGNIFRKTWWSITYFKADGRIMVDGQSFRRMNPNYRHEDYTGSQVGSATNNILDTISEENYYKTWPTLYGFSFVSKKWGEINVSALRPVTFDSHAFDRLVLDSEKKQLIKALVEKQNSITFADIIEGKGGGCIILLHGQPGVGKTLTAEAIAELLRRPLYSVGVGELGTNTEQLENSLREILEVASTWNAVLLIDEADIFLEKRSENDITRNAMVGIFLRLLEYHQGVLFLTTNRVKTFDKAFHSRISIALRYEDLGIDAREKVWKNFLEYAKIEGIDTKPLAKHDLNGRQIKTVIRLAQALSLSLDEPLTMKHFDRAVGVTEKFQDDMLSASKSPDFNDAQ